MDAPAAADCSEYQPARFLPPVGPLVQEVLDQDSRPVPSNLREQSAVYMGDEDLDAARYFSQEFHDLEMKYVWKKVWQLACREDDISDPGDHILYEIGDEQIIVVRTQDGDIRAFPNACLHRGTTLVTCAGNVDRFRCPFHGFTWSLEGELVNKPSAWDFKHVTKENFRLPDVRVSCWAGFVFITLSDETPPLEEYLDDLPDHFKEWPMEHRYKAVHVAKVIKCNWKAAMEAFLEGYHIPATHPQSGDYSGDVQGQYDVWPDKRHINRVHVWFGAMRGGQPRQDPNDVVDAMLRDMPAIGKPGDIRVGPDESARIAVAQRFREVLGKSTGVDFDAASDAEMLDAIQYFVFPNIVPWRGVGSPIVYRFRPYKNDPNASIMEIMYLFVRHPDAPKKKGVPIHWLRDDESFVDAKELGGLGVVFDQDLSNLERVQIGLRATHKKGVTLASYQEIRIRHYHKIIDEYIAEGRARDAAAQA